VIKSEVASKGREGIPMFRHVRNNIHQIFEKAKKYDFYRALANNFAKITSAKKKNS